MIDRIKPTARSRVMSSIRSKDTGPELMVRRFLHARGFRYRLHQKDLPGKPDVVMRKHKLVIFVHGCFWHSHEGCYYATKPSSRTEFWADKLSKNVTRDLLQQKALMEMGWRILVIWGCGLKLSPDKLQQVIPMIESDRKWMEWPRTPLRKA